MRGRYSTYPISNYYEVYSSKFYDDAVDFPETLEEGMIRSAQSFAELKALVHDKSVFYDIHLLETGDSFFPIFANDREPNDRLAAKSVSLFNLASQVARPLALKDADTNFGPLIGAVVPTIVSEIGPSLN